MEILIVRDPITVETLNALAQAWHIALVKGAVDIKTGVIALGGEWHMDANNRLIEEGSDQRDIWGFNIYPYETGSAAIEYISLINIRPMQGNRGMDIMNEEIRNMVRKIVAPAVPFIGL